MAEVAGMPGPRVVNALSVDVEEYYHALVFQEAVRGRAHHGFERRGELSTERVLALFARGSFKGTPFDLSQLAAAHPSIVRKITQKEEEVACHSHPQPRRSS